MRHLTDSGVRFSVIGRRDRIPGSLRRSIAHVEERTSEGTSLHLRVAIDYSARDALLAAAGRVASGTLPTRQAFEQSLYEAIHAPSGTRDVDLLIRTGGEQRLSDFLLWESAYAELYFTDVLWPDFSEADLASAVQAFAARDRRYGGILASRGPARMSQMRRFLVCIHDATPAYARETRVMIRDLAPLLGRRLSFGVVPDWHGEWPLAAHPDYCRLVREGSEELLLHGYFHQRQRGWGPTTLLAERSDEMNGLDPEETRRTLERGQRVFTEVFGEPARGFLAPAWQLGHVRLGERECRSGWSTSWAFSPSSRARAERFPWRPGPGTVAAGAGSGTSAMGSGGCFSRWIVESRPWRFTPEIWSGVSGRRSSGSPSELLETGLRTEHAGGVARGE